VPAQAQQPGAVKVGLHTPAIDARIAAEAEQQGMSPAEAARQFLSERQPSGRFVEGGNIAALIAFLCGPAGRDITGALLPGRRWLDRKLTTDDRT
jgi:3-hydroxybutyrate dehydrogenase